MNVGMDALTPASLDWALTHVRRFGDTDLFPVPFEFEAIEHSWPAFRKELASRDVADIKIRTARRFLVPKPGGGFRVAVQLDPLDAIVYTALIYEMAEALEKSRVPANKKIACSYRIQLDPNGSFFSPTNGWREFHERSAELTGSRDYSHVLLADVSDFYNQISHHRITNALELAAISPERAQNVERILSRLTAKQSRGLPVGPFASILLAEMCLNDVDSFLLRNGVTYTRYVDDFRIFCASRRQAVEVHHNLVEYLYTSHRLSLESSKTRMMHVRKFVSEELRDPEEDQQRAEVEKLKEIVDDLIERFGPYEVPEDLAEEKEMASKAARGTLLELFKGCVDKPPLQLGLARHLLRRGSTLGTTGLHARVFKNLEMLTPVLRDVVRYLAKTLPNKVHKEHGGEFLSFLKKSDLGSLPFVRLWALDLVERKPRLLAQDDALGIASGSKDKLGIRPYALLAKKYKLVDWVRSQKETWTNHGDWDRRAVIWSGSILSRDEKKHWLRLVQDTGDALDGAVARLAQSQ